MGAGSRPWESPGALGVGSWGGLLDPLWASSQLSPHPPSSPLLMAVGTVTWDRWALFKVVQRPFQHTLSAVMILSGPTAKRRNCPKPGSPPAGVEDGRPVHRWPGPPHRPPTQSAPATERPLTGDATKGAACDPVHLALLGGGSQLSLPLPGAMLVPRPSRDRWNRPGGQGGVR